MTPHELLAEALATDTDDAPALPAPAGNFPVGVSDRPPWMRDALCRERPTTNYFPELGESPAAAKAVCASCLVRAECLAYAVETGEDHGVWGGMSPVARKALRRAQTAA